VLFRSVGRAEAVGLGLLTLAAILVRAYAVPLQESVSLAGMEFLATARALAGAPAGEVLRPLGYPALVFPAKTLIGDWVRAGQAVSLLAGVALVPLLWMLGRRILRRPGWAFRPAAAVAFLPVMVRGSVLAEAPMTAAALTVAVFLLALGRRPLAAGIAAGWAVLTMPATALAFLALMIIRRTGGVLRFAAAASVVVALGLALAASLGGPALPLGVDVSVASWDERDLSTEALTQRGDVLRQYAGTAGPVLRGAPGRFLDLIEAMWSQLGYGIVLLVPLGIVGGGGVLLAGAATALAYPFFHVGGAATFLVLLLPFLWLMAVTVVDRLPVRAGLAVALLLAGLAGVTVARESRIATRTADGHYPELVEAGEWLGTRIRRGSRVADLKGYAAFYGNAIRRDIPERGGYEEVLDAIVASDIDYVVLHQGVTRAYRPELLPLVVDKPVVWHETRLDLVRADTRYLDGTTTVFRVVRPGGPGPMALEGDILKDVGEIDHSKNHYFHGVLAMRAERWSAAAGEFVYVIAKNPDAEGVEYALNNRAWCLYRMGALDQASSEARKAVNLQPENLDFMDTLIRVLAAQERASALEHWLGIYAKEATRQGVSPEIQDLPDPEAEHDETEGSHEGHSHGEGGR